MCYDIFMKKIILIITLIILILGGAFYWYELRPLYVKKNCFAKADAAKQIALNADNNVIMNGYELTKRANYDKILDDEYKKCLMENGIKE